MTNFWILIGLGAIQINMCEYLEYNVSQIIKMKLDTCIGMDDIIIIVSAKIGYCSLHTNYTIYHSRLKSLFDSRAKANLKIQNLIGKFCFTL